MSPALLDRAQQQRLPGPITRTAGRRQDEVRRAVARGSRQRPHLGARGTRTLDQLITTSWQGLAVGEGVRCPVCHGRMAPRVARGDHADGCCADCGTTLA
jgi:hypothetical protein